MSDLVAFLTARLDEDEQAALRWPEEEQQWQVVGGRMLSYDNGAKENVVAIDVSNKPCLWWERIYVKRDLDGLSEHVARHDPARVLREVEAMRRIVKLAQQAEEASNTSVGDSYMMAADYTESVLRLLASVYADHPDYQQEWRP